MNTQSQENDMVDTHCPLFIAGRLYSIRPQRGRKRAAIFVTKIKYNGDRDTLPYPFEIHFISLNKHIDMLEDISDRTDQSDEQRFLLVSHGEMDQSSPIQFGGKRYIVTEL